MELWLKGGCRVSIITRGLSHILKPCLGDRRKTIFSVPVSVSILSKQQLNECVKVAEDGPRICNLPLFSPDVMPFWSLVGWEPSQLCLQQTQ